MSSPQSSGCLKAALLTAVIGGIGFILISVAAVIVWIKRDDLGLSRFGPQSEEGGSPQRPRAASAPLTGNARTYRESMQRDDVLVMVDYYADWCGPCRQIAPHLSNLAARHGDKVVVLKVNVDHEKGLARQAGIRSIPDVRLYHAGKELERVIGGRPYDHYEGLVLRHARRLPEPGDTPAPVSLPASGGDESITPMREDWAPPGVTPVR